MKQWIEYAVENYRGKNSFGFQLAKDLKERQIIQAIERYARGVKPEEVVALMDTSVFRSGKTGFLLTERYLYSDKYKEEGAVSLMFLKSVSVRQENNSCCVLTFKDDSTRDVDISVFLDVVDVLKLIIKQRDEHEADDEEAADSVKDEEEEQKRQGKENTETVAQMRALGYQKGTAEDRTVFEDSAEDFLRTVRPDESVRDAAVPKRPLGDGPAASESSLEGAPENPGEGIMAIEEPAGQDDAQKLSGYTGITIEAVRPSEGASPGECEKPEDYEASNLSIEIIPVDEFEESGEAEESREQRWLSEFSQSGEPGDLILEDEVDFAQGQEEPVIAGQEGDCGDEGGEETGGSGEKTGGTDQAEESFEELLEKAEAGDSAAMYQAAELYFTGEQAVRDSKPCEDAQQAQNAGKIESVDLVQDVKQAMRWFRESARLEYVPAMLKMMHFYREGEQVKKNYTLSLSWAKKAAATGDQRGQYALVDSYLYGLDGKQDTGAGLALLSKMAEQGDESAKRTADDVLNKIREAKERFDAGIKNPSTASGYYEMGMYCLKGDGFYNYPKEAVRYLKKAAEKEHVHAEYQLALAYHTGDGVKKDEDECIRWLEKAAEKSHKEAGELLAELQEKRRIRQEKAEFKNHLRQAEKGDAYAQSKTAELYLVGIGVKQDIQKGIEWYEKASETDEGYAARQLAKLYSEGEFVPVDPEKAAYWRMVGGVLDEL